MFRSNYFTVKDVPSFRRFCRRWDIELINDNKGRYGFLHDGWTYFQSHEELGEYILGWENPYDEDDEDQDEDDDEDEGPIEPHPEATFDEQLAALLA